MCVCGGGGDGEGMGWGGGGTAGACGVRTSRWGYEGPVKSSVTNRLPWFYPSYILKCFTALE